MERINNLTAMKTINYLALNYSSSVFAFETALYLNLLLSNIPFVHITLDEKSIDKNIKRLIKNKMLKVSKAPECKELGLGICYAPNGRLIKCYDIERSIIDIMLRDGLNSYSFYTIINKYLNSVYRDLDKLNSYAYLLGVDFSDYRTLNRRVGV